MAPWQKFAVRAAFWYQGEANADQKVSAADAKRGVTLTNYYSQYVDENREAKREGRGTTRGVLFAVCCVLCPVHQCSCTAVLSCQVLCSAALCSVVVLCLAVLCTVVHHYAPLYCTVVQ